MESADFIKVGDRVKAIDEPLNGVVLEVMGDQLMIEWDDGFSERMSRNEVVLAAPFVPDLQRKPIPNKDASARGRANSRIPKSKKDRSVMEVDLHAHALVPNPKRYEPWELRELQLAKAKEAFRTAEQKRVYKLILIHGKGEGKLRELVASFLRGQDGIEFFDAEFLRFKGGATEVRFKKNS